MVIASVTKPRATVICERLREFGCFIFSWDSNNRPITRNAPRVSNKATKSRDKQCVTTILVNNSSHGDPRLPPSVSETIAGSQVTNGWKHKIIDITMITWHNTQGEGDYCYERILWIFLHFFSSGNVMMMKAGNHRVLSLSQKYSKPRNIPGTGDFLFGFYPTPKHFKLGPFISDWEEGAAIVRRTWDYIFEHCG